MKHIQQTFTDKETMLKLTALADVYQLWVHLAYETDETKLSNAHAVYFDKMQMHGKPNQWPWNVIEFPDVSRDAYRNLSVNDLRTFLENIPPRVSDFLVALYKFKEISIALRKIEVAITKCEMEIMEKDTWWTDGFVIKSLYDLVKDNLVRHEMQHSKVLKSWEEALGILEVFKDLVETNKFGNKITFNSVAKGV